MIKEKLTRFLTLVFVVSIIISACTGSKNRVFDLSFRLNKMKLFVPSNQLVVWLEKSDGSFVKTLFISEYLAYGGFNIPTICPDWSTKANWQESVPEDFDAITGATPQNGIVDLELQCLKKEVPEGNYNVMVEVHLAEDFNELYQGNLVVSRKKFSNELKVTYKPEKYSKMDSTDILSNVQVTCK